MADVVQDPDDINKLMSDYEKQVRSYVKGQKNKYDAEGNVIGQENEGLNEQEVAEKLAGRKTQIESDPLRAQRMLLKDFESKAPQMQSQAIEGAASGERRRLAGELSGIKSGASSRGLLYSGMRQGQEAKSRAMSDVNQAESRANINNAFNQQRQQLKADPIKTGLNVAQMQSGIADQAMTQAINNMQCRQQALGGLGSAIGQGVGTYFGRKDRNS